MLASVSHDVRAPLNGVVSILNFVLEMLYCLIFKFSTVRVKFKLAACCKFFWILLISTSLNNSKPWLLYVVPTDGSTYALNSALILEDDLKVQLSNAFMYLIEVFDSSWTEKFNCSIESLMLDTSLAKLFTLLLRCCN